MRVWKEYIEQERHPSIKKLEKAAIEYGRNCVQIYIRNVKIEINLDVKNESVIINVLKYRV
jgi:hypothetical protein